MAIYKAEAVKTTRPAPTVKSGHELYVSDGVITDVSASFPETSGNLASLAILPANCALVDLILFCEDLDTGATPTLTMSVGVLNTGETDIGSAIIATSVVGKAGGVARMDTIVGHTLGLSTSDRKLAVKIGTGAATPASADIRLIAMFRGKIHGA